MFKSVTKIGYHIDNALIGGEDKIIVIKMKFNHIHKKCGHCIHRCTLKGKGWAGERALRDNEVWRAPSGIVHFLVYVPTSQ